MSRSGYTEDDDDPLAYGRWRQAVKRALQGKRGQAMLRELIAALDAMSDKRLYPGSFATADGEFCALGAVAARRGIQVDDLGDEDDGCDPEQVGQRFGIARAMAAEIMYMNDEYLVGCDKWIDVVICGPMPQSRLLFFRGHEVAQRVHERHERSVRIHNHRHPEQRWELMRAWAVEHLKTPNV